MGRLRIGAGAKPRRAAAFLVSPLPPLISPSWPSITQALKWYSHSCLTDCQTLRIFTLGHLPTFSPSSIHKASLANIASYNPVLVTHSAPEHTQGPGKSGMKEAFFSVHNHA